MRERGGEREKGTYVKNKINVASSQHNTFAFVQETWCGVWDGTIFVPG